MHIFKKKHLTETFDCVYIPLVSHVIHVSIFTAQKQEMAEFSVKLTALPVTVKWEKPTDYKEDAAGFRITFLPDR